MSVEESPLLKEFKTYLQATLVAFGSEGALFSLVNQRFSEDWTGSPSLKEYAAKLGFTGQKGIFKLLESIPDQVTILVSPTGEIILKPVPLEETRDNLSKIDATNKELKAERMRQQRQQGPLSAAVTAQIAAAMMQCCPQQVPGHTLASVFNASIKRTSAVPSAVGPPPLSLPKKINPNFIPLGPTPFARCTSASNIADSIIGSGQSASVRMPKPQQQPQDIMSFFGLQKRQPAVVCNDFGDIMPVPPSTTHVPVAPSPTHVSVAPDIMSVPPSTTHVPVAPDIMPVPPSTTQTITSPSPVTIEAPPQKPSTSATEQKSTQQLNKSKKINFEQAMRLMEREAWKQAEKRSDAYYEEDFRASASPRFGSPEPRASTQPQPELSKTEPKEEHAENEEPKREAKIEAKMEIDETDEEDYTVFSDSSEYDWDFLDGIMDHDDWQDEHDNKECDAFLQKFLQTYSKPVPEDIYRLVHIFRNNSGSFSKMDMLEKKYFDTYGTRLNSSERNRLLGSPTSTRIAKDSFSKAAYPGLFRVSERMSNCYGVNLLPCLSGNYVDPSMFWSASLSSADIDILLNVSSSPSLLTTTPSRPSTSESIKQPSATFPIQTLDEMTLYKPDRQLKQADPILKQFPAIEAVLSAYAELLDSLKEPPVLPPFHFGHLVLFRHAKFGLRCGKVVRQDNHHVVLKKLDDQSEHYVEMSDIFAFPDQLLKEHDTKARPSFRMCDHPGISIDFIAPIKDEKFRYF